MIIKPSPYVAPDTTDEPVWLVHESVYATVGIGPNTIALSDCLVVDDDRCCRAHVTGSLRTGT
jgi:hypothetical protein